MARQRKRKGDPVTGWLNLFKPIDMTSTKAVAILKRLYNAEKVGHGGTLDPLADGILPIAFGEATKTVQWAMDSEKDYVFTIKWGDSTASQDAEGEVTASSDVRPTKEQVIEVLQRQIGEIEQVPPKFSAIKVDGQRAYDLAREGEDFELKSRQVMVYSAEVIGMPDADHTVIHVTSGKGFYVRAMARDLAFDLGAEGHISQLRRTRVGGFTAAEAVPLSALEEMTEKDDLMAALRPLQSVMDAVPSVMIGPDDVRNLKQGRSIMLMPHIVEKWQEDRNQDDEDDRLAIALMDDVAIALGDIRAGQFEPRRVFQNQG